MNDHLKEMPLFDEFPPISSEEWQDVILNDLKGADFEKKLIWKTYDGMALHPYYRQQDMEMFKHLDSLPGETPYTRGNKTNNNGWIIRQDIPGSDPKIINTHARKAAESGASALGINVSEIQTPDQLKALLHGINLKEVQLHFTEARSYPKFLHLFLDYLDKEKIDKSILSGSFDYDPLADFCLKGVFDKSWDLLLEDLSGFIKNTAKEIPRFKSVNVHACLFHDAGSSLVQELGYGLLMANEYLASLTGKGLSVDDITPRMMFTFSVGSDYFPEIAKLRAARYLWNTLVEQYHPVKDSAAKMFIHSTTLFWNKTLFDPYVNILRTTTEAMAAALAGSEMISVETFDITYKEPDEFSLRIARNQQIILQQESYLGNIIDPAAGSYYIEKLTDEIARLSWDIFKTSETKGGFISCFNENLVQEEIEAVSLVKLNDIANRKTTVLGVNQYPNLNEEMSGKVTKPPVSGLMDLQSIKCIKPFRGSAALELIRLETEKHQKSSGKKPQVFLFSMGNLAMRKARAIFSSNFFGCAGYTIIDNPGFQTVDEGVTECLRTNPAITVICSSDEEYLDFVPSICEGLRKEGYRGIMVLAGYPKDAVEKMKAAGIDEFIHVRTNLLDSLQHFNKLLGISH